MWRWCSIFDIQGPFHRRGSPHTLELSPALFNYKEVLKAAPIGTVRVEKEGKILYRVRLAKVIT